MKTSLQEVNLKRGDARARDASISPKKEGDRDPSFSLLHFSARAETLWEPEQRILGSVVPCGDELSRR